MLTLLEKYWKPLALIALVALLLWRYGDRQFSAGKNAANLSWSAKWSARDAADEKAKAAEEARQRNFEQQRLAAAMEEGKRANEELAKAKVAAANAKRAGDSLQQQLARLQKQFNAERATSSLSAAAAVSQAKSETIVLLTQLYRESDKAAGEYAEEADRNYVKTGSCERTYYKIINSK
ncbi:TPA: DUF2514 family protein [Klebsiella aerogenes]|nr:DUF2514 family protein [Klebsiella aerogenes]